MKAWTTATAAGQCSFDSAHHWKQGDTVFTVSGAGWSKKFCPSCAMQRHGAGEFTGSGSQGESRTSQAALVTLPDPVIRRPSEKPLKAMADQVAEQLDVRMRQAGKE